MQLLNIGIARSIWLFDLNEMNPRGKSIVPDALVWLGEKYHFQTFPKSPMDVDKETKGFLFRTGEFQTEEGSFNVNLSMYTDGFVAETWSSTERTDAFLDELLRSVANKFDLPYNADLVKVKRYISEVNFRLDKPLGNINPRITRFCETLNGIFARHHLRPFELTGMIFAPDVVSTSYQPPGFMIERKQGAAFSENRFWSKAPFTTKEHLVAIEEFEKMLVQHFIEVQPTQHARQITLTDDTSQRGEVDLE